MADFETINDENDCRVWLFNVENIETGESFSNVFIEDFFNFLKYNPGTYYFHNLKFDGGFLLSYLLINNYKWCKGTYFDKKSKQWCSEWEPYTFNTLISDNNIFYTIEICFDNRRVRIIDSLKIINMPVARIAKAFNLPTAKGKIDYNKYRAPGSPPSKKELSYVKTDTHIVAQGLKHFFDLNLTKITQGSNAFTALKKSLHKPYREIFPDLSDIDKEIRGCYKGGYCIVNPSIQGQDVSYGEVYDSNSMYPDKMRNYLMPYGIPKKFEGKYMHDKNYPLYIIHINCIFELKDGHLPCIQLKNYKGNFIAVEYLKNSKGLQVGLTLTSVDLKIIRKHYKLYQLEYLYGWKFMGKKGIFNDYIDYWYEIKLQATLEGNAPLREIAKVMLNACYGKFGTRTKINSKIPYLDESGIVKYKLSEEIEKRPAEYLPVAAFITAYARWELINIIHANLDRFLYCDTDSIHLQGFSPPKHITIHSTKLGAWKKESWFHRARYIHAKCYIEDRFFNDHEIKCAGLPANLHSKITWFNFFPGLSLSGKLRHKTVKGGVILQETPFNLN